MATKKNVQNERAQRAAEAMKAQQKQEARRRNITIGAVVLVLVAMIAAMTIYLMNNDESSKIDAAKPGSGDSGMTIGEAGEGVPEVVIYEDFHCVHCASLEAATSKGLTELATDGKVFVEYRPINFLSDYSARATNAFKVVLEESGPTVAKKFHDLLFENYSNAGQEGLDNDTIVELAVDAGAEEDAVRPGIEDMSQQEWVDKVTEEAKKANVTGTPTILLDGERFEGGTNSTEQGENLLEELSKG